MKNSKKTKKKLELHKQEIDQIEQFGPAHSRDLSSVTSNTTMAATPTQSNSIKVHFTFIINKDTMRIEYS